MNIEIISVGTEMLLGEIINTNASFIAVQCAKMGIPVYFQTVVGDNAQRLTDALVVAFGRADCVITTGGLGPTQDDLTKETCAAFLGLPLVMNQDALLELRSFFTVMNREMPKNNEKQVMFPDKSIILNNKNGTAPGCIMQLHGKTIINLPGPPREMEPMFVESVIPFLQKHSQTHFVTRSLHITGLGESKIDEMLSGFMNNSNPTVAPYAHEGEVTVRLAATASTVDRAHELLHKTETDIRVILGDHNIYGTDDETLESVVVSLFMRYGLTVSAAESCTGGLLSARIVDVPGVSAVFNGGIIAYSNDTKTKVLNIDPAIIQKHGAVSKEAAEAMALAVAALLDTDVGIAVTGIAGPGAEGTKPVGLVFIAVSIYGDVRSAQLNLKGSRQKIRAVTVSRTLDFIRRALLETFAENGLSNTQQ